MTENQTVYRCKQCNKPFNEHSAWKRHGYYCRSRRGEPVVRVRSCLSCAKSKLKCDNGRPECSRCKGHGVACQYPAKASKRAKPAFQASDVAVDTVSNPGLLSPTTDESPDEQVEPQVSNIANSIVWPHADGLWLGDNSQSTLDWDYSMDLDKFMIPTPDDKVVEYPLQIADLDSDILTPPVNLGESWQHSANYVSFGIPRSPSSNPRSLVHRPKLAAGTHRSSKLVLKYLKGYPLMMLKDGALPPFVHHLLADLDGATYDMESFRNCMILVHMLSSPLQGARKLFWKNVRMECERILHERKTFNRWQSLAAMQAISIYIILRVDEGETEDNNVESLLLACVITLSKQLTSDAAHPPMPTNTVGLRWEDWVFEESTRRICVVYKVINMLVHFEPAVMCDLQTGLLIAPLPAKRQLWEADNELAWQHEISREAGAQKTFGMATDGELVALDDGQWRCSDTILLSEEHILGEKSSRSKANWEDWCASMDGFGGLVMLAASMDA